MGAWDFGSFCTAGKPPCPQNPRFRGGVLRVFWGGKCQLYFYGRGDFSDTMIIWVRVLSPPDPSADTLPIVNDCIPKSQTPNRNVFVEGPNPFRKTVEGVAILNHVSKNNLPKCLSNKGKMAIFRVFLILRLF